MVENAVLFETFARVGYARMVFDAIKEAKPKKLYFYSNKARAERPEEVRGNEEIRKWVEEVDWECELHTWFRDEYVDIYTSLRGAITWAFENEEQVIVLEDDCVPTLAFFSFCDKMLSKYKNDKRVWYVSGDNFLNNNPSGKDYQFSHYHFIYGWASWRDRWNETLWDSIPWDSLIGTDFFNDFYKSDAQIKFRNKELTRVRDFVNRTNSWDFVFGITADIKGGLRLVPREHLVSYVGMQGENSMAALKTMFQTEAHPEYSEYTFTNEPTEVNVDKEYDYLFFLRFERHMRLYNRIIRRGFGTIVKYLKKICHCG